MVYVPKTKNPVAKLKITKNPRITPRMRDVIHDIVYEAMSLPEVAKKHGYNERSLRQLLRQPHLTKLKNEVWRERWSSEAEKSADTLCKLRDSAKSENVRLEAAKTIASSDDRFQTGSKLTLGGNIGVQAVGYVIDLRDDSPAVPPIIDMGKITEET